MIQFKKIQNASLQLTDRANEVKYSARYGIFVDGMQVGEIRNSRNGMKVFDQPEWNVCDMDGRKHGLGRDTLKEAKEVAVKKVLGGKLLAGKKLSENSSQATNKI